MIVVHELTKRFGGADDIVAVDRISFQVRPSEVYGLLGANGAGKTTTLRMIVGLLTPSSGYAEVDGVRSDEQADDVKRRIGLVSTSAGLYQWLSPREMLEFFADLYGLSAEQTAVNLARIADVLDLHSFLDRRCSTLSTGQKQRVNLARALMHDPPIMLLDEPTRGLDVVGSQVVFDYIAHLRQQGKAVIVSTHQLDEAARLCDRFGLLHRGRLVEEGTFDELCARTGCNNLVEIMMRYVRGDEAFRESVTA